MFAAPASSYITGGGNGRPSRQRLLYPQMFSSRTSEEHLSSLGSDGMFGAVTTPDRTGPRHLISNHSLFRATSWLGDVLTMLTAELARRTVCVCVLQEVVHQHLLSRAETVL